MISEIITAIGKYSFSILEMGKIEPVSGKSKNLRQT